MIYTNWWWVLTISKCATKAASWKDTTQQSLVQEDSPTCAIFVHPNIKPLEKKKGPRTGGQNVWRCFFLVSELQVTAWFQNGQVSPSTPRERERALLREARKTLRAMHGHAASAEHHQFWFRFLPLSSTHEANVVGLRSLTMPSTSTLLAKKHLIFWLAKMTYDSPPMLSTLAALAAPCLGSIMLQLFAPSLLPPGGLPTSQRVPGTAQVNGFFNLFEPHSLERHPEQLMFSSFLNLSTKQQKHQNIRFSFCAVLLSRLLETPPK